MAALLHDVVEDTETTLADLYNEGYNDRVIELVDLMTRREGERYFDYIDRIIAGGSTASLIKIADIADNLRPERAVEGHDLASRYFKAIKKLMAGLD